jgi:hypothetical protein
MTSALPLSTHCLPPRVVGCFSGMLAAISGHRFGGVVGRATHRPNANRPNVASAVSCTRHFLPKLGLSRMAAFLLSRQNKAADGLSRAAARDPGARIFQHPKAGRAGHWGGEGGSTVATPSKRSVCLRGAEGAEAKRGVHHKIRHYPLRGGHICRRQRVVTSGPGKMGQGGRF